MEPYEALEATATKLEECGWIRGAYYDSQGHVCMAGALENVCKNDSVLEHECAEAIQEYLDWEGGIEDWNDNQATDVDEVVSVLRNIALKMRPDEMRIDGNL